MSYLTSLVLDIERLLNLISDLKVMLVRKNAKVAAYWMTTERECVCPIGYGPGDLHPVEILDKDPLHRFYGNF